MSIIIFVHYNIINISPWYLCHLYQEFFYYFSPLQLPKAQPVALIASPEDTQNYEVARQCVEELALYLKPLSNTRGT